jgi:hypothetical protein
MNRSTLPFQRGVYGGVRMWRAPVCVSSCAKRWLLR